MNNGDKPASPIDVYIADGWYGNTKREHFAAMAMQGLLANNKSTGENLYKDMAEVAVFAADALLAALESNNEA